MNVDSRPTMRSYKWKIELLKIIQISSSTLPVLNVMRRVIMKINVLTGLNRVKGIMSQMKLLRWECLLALQLVDSTGTAF
jgi:hypothetical protein